MQLKIQRSQRLGGALANKIIFVLDVRAQYNAKETADINKYRLGGELVYASRKHEKHMENAQKAEGIGGVLFSVAMAKMNLTITVASLMRGHHIECKDLAELIEAEKTVREACENLQNYLRIAATFNGGIILVDFDEGGPKEHVSGGMVQIDPPAPAQRITRAGPAEISLSATEAAIMQQPETSENQRSTYPSPLDDLAPPASAYAPPAGLSAAEFRQLLAPVLKAFAPGNPDASAAYGMLLGYLVLLLFVSFSFGTSGFVLVLLLSLAGGIGYVMFRGLKA